MFKLSTSIIVQTFAKSLILRSIPLVAAGLIVILSLFPASARAFHLDPDLNPAPPFVVCEHQQYALCAEASCFVYNGVSYCRCEVSRGNSISLQLSYASPNREQNVCDVNAQGKTNGYMVSTFSLPNNVKKGGNAAVYTCPGSSDELSGVPAPIAYGQCDGGICFDSTRGQNFPGFIERLHENEIICSCPISTDATSGSSDSFGYQVFGPYDPTAPIGSRCDANACASCSVTNPSANGSTIPVGAPTGGGKFLTLQLEGSIPEINECLCTCTQGANGSVSCAVGEDRTQ
jgi:hypothetical protein